MIFNKNFIQIKDSVNDWEDAISIASSPLLKESVINENYIKKMISNVEEMGPYIVLSKDIAMPHARFEDGAKDSAIAVLKLKKRVSFSKDKNVNTIIALACSTNNDHIETLQYLAKILSDKKKYKRLVETYDIDEIYNILKKEE